MCWLKLFPSRRDPDLPIGVFDSGVGGLTVLRAIRAALPHESTIYLGDTARVPYGTKSRDSVLRYSLQASHQLVERGGTTLRDFLRADGEPGYFQLELLAYEREGMPCKRCGTRIRRVVIGQRSSYYCPRCQRS